MRQAIVIITGIVVAVAMILFMKSRASKQKKQAPVVGSAASSNLPPSPPSMSIDAAPSTPSSVRRLAPEERKRLGEQIEAARMARATSANGSAPELPPEEALTLDELNKALKDHLMKAIPILAKCYEAEKHAGTAAAQMTLTTDPELGTVIDTDAITDGDDKPLDPKLDECLRETIDTLAMPPLADRAGKIKLKYSFRFDE